MGFNKYFYLNPLEILEFTMTTVSEAAIAASVILGLISIPAVSQTTTSPDSFQADLPNVSSSESTPVRVSQTTSAEGFQASIETAFDEFTAQVSRGSANASLESPGSSLEVEKTPEGVEWTLTTPEGKLTVRKSSTRAVETTSTAQGTLEVVRQNGAVSERFTGSDRSAVEKTRNQLKQLMHQRKTDLDRKRQQLRQQAQPDIELVVNSSTASGYGNNTQEHVILINNEPKPVNIDGWTLQNNNPDSYTFGDVSIPAYSRLRVYTSDEDQVPFDGEAVYDTGLSWENGGDTATLLDQRGTQIAKQEY